jgi:glycolate oxidase FAD binding subunit
MSEEARAGGKLAFVGGGTNLGIGHPPDRLDAIVRTERMTRIIEHAPSDQIVVAEAGLTLASLARATAASGQRLALDPPLPERATLGGVVAANAFGPLRTKYGSIRDLIIGVSFVRADGVLARGGGKVVKNVAGFDLPKLMVGSLGTLGFITTVTVRLHPLPEARFTLLLPQRTPSQIRALAQEMRQAQLEPAAVIAVTGETGLDVAVRFEGFEAGARKQRDRFVAHVGQGSGCQALDDAGDREIWAKHDRLRGFGKLRAKFAALPGAVETIMAEAITPLVAALDDGAVVFYPTLGLGFVTGGAGASARVGLALAAARRVLARAGGSLVLHDAPAAIRATCDVWGDAPPALMLMQSMKMRLDPERRLCPGRFVGGV